VLRVGLTGNVGSGKSTVAGTWRRLGASIIDADVLARRAVEPGTPGLRRVREAFGESVIVGGALDRAALRRKVFRDPAARKRLEEIIHPEVARLAREEVSALTEKGVDIAVHEIPLLYEVGLEHTVDLIVLVDAPEDVRAERLARDRGLGASEIRDLMAAQMPADRKRAKADIVIDNDGTLAELEGRAERVWSVIRDRAAASPSPERLELRDADPAGPRCRVDMHIHTRLSFDSLNRPDAVVQRSVEVGLDRICITDHNEIEAALDLAERYPDRVIPGEEVKTREGVDVIGLFLQEWIPKGTPARETCERIHDQGGLVYVPHPFAGGKGGGGRILSEIEDLVDAVEGFNARIHDASLNERAQHWARDRGLPLGAGSDAHTLGEIGRAHVEVPLFDADPGSFLAALRYAKIQGRESPRWVHVASTLAKLVP